MVILFILVGSLIGAVAAALALWTGGSVLFAMLCYSIFGALGGLAVVIAVYMRGASKSEVISWADGQKGEQPVSA